MGLDFLSNLAVFPINHQQLLLPHSLFLIPKSLILPSMVEQYGYPFKPGECGIDFSQLNVGDKKQIFSGSGRILTVEVRPNKVLIKDMIMSQCGMTASAYLSRELEQASASFHLFTRYGIDYSQVHPDMFAAKFIGFSLQFFQEHFASIHRVHSHWASDKGGCTFRSFKEQLRKTENENEAAMQSWTGRVLSGYGFTSAEVDSWGYDSLGAEGLFVSFHK